MAGPAIAAYTPQVLAALRAAGPRIAQLAKASGEQLARIGARLGISDKAKLSASYILEQAKNNKLVSAMVLYELYGMADETLQRLFDADPDLKSAVSLFAAKPDEPDQAMLASNAKMRDEFDMIVDAARLMGSFNRLVTLKKALMLSDATYLAYLDARSTGRHLI